MAYAEQHPQAEPQRHSRPHVKTVFTADEWLQFGIAQCNVLRRAMANGDERGAAIARETALYCLDRAHEAIVSADGKAAVLS